MALGPRLDLRHSQQLVMTPQLRQAIKLLHYSNLEVTEFVEGELERNPLLERDEGGDGADPDATDPADPAGDPTGAERDVADLVADAAMEDRISSPLDLGEPFDPGTGADGAGAATRGTFDGEERGLEEMLAGRRSLREHVAEQIRLAFPGSRERLIGTYLLALLDPSGRLLTPPASLAATLGCPLETLEAVRRTMQNFDPVGMFCLDLRECLAVQLADRNRLDPAMAALLDHLDLLGRRDLRALMAICGVDAEDLADMIAEIRALDPKPGALFEVTPLPPLIPDVLMRRAGGGDWIVEMNPETLPRLLVNLDFHARVTRGAAPADRSYLAEQLQSANWLVKSLRQRAETILKVAAEIVRRQDAFFRHGVQHLRPLVLREIAAELSLHESTISRVTSNKYIATPRGTFELKFFFTTAIAGIDGESHSAEAVRHRIRALIGAEPPGTILSDDAIVTILRREGVDIARRTVAKYREALHIPNSAQRRRDKMALA